MIMVRAGLARIGDGHIQPGSPSFLNLLSLFALFSMLPPPNPCHDHCLIMSNEHGLVSYEHTNIQIYKYTNISILTILIYIASR